MKTYPWALIFVCLCNDGVFGQESAYPHLAPSHDVSVIQYEWQDAKRNRAVPAKVYYPKEGSGPFPVIVFSHGLGGCARL